MKKIVLACALGASTSMLCKKMINVAKQENYECTVEAHSHSEINSSIDCDIILLGPQVRFLKDEIAKKVSCPVEVMDMRDYGSMNASKILSRVKAIVGE